MTDFLFIDIPNQNIRNGTDLVLTTGRDSTGVSPGTYVADALATPALLASHPELVAQSSNGRIFRALPVDGRIPVEMAGAIGDGTTDDRIAISAAIAYADAIGASGVTFGRKHYLLSQIPAADLPLVAGTRPRLVIAPKPAVMDWGGAALVTQAGGKGLAFGRNFNGGVIELPLAADVVVGTRTLTLQPGLSANLAVGDLVTWQLGEVPNDTTETINWDIARVVAIAGDDVTLDKPMPEGLVLSTVTGANKRLRKMPLLRDFVLRDLELDAEDLETGVQLYGAQRVTLERVGGTNMRGGLVMAQYCDGLTLNDCWQDGALVFNASNGAAFAFAECRNVHLNRPRVRDALTMVRAEAGAEVSVVSPHFENTMTDASGNPLGNQVIAFHPTGRGKICVHNATVTGFGGYSLANTSNGIVGWGGSILFTGITRLNHPTSPYSIPLEFISGTLDMTIGGVQEIYNMERLRQWKRRFVLRDGESLSVFGPTGMLVRARTYTSPGLTVGPGQQLTSFNLGRQGDAGFNIANGVNGQLIPGKDTGVRLFGGAVGGAQWNLRLNPLKITVITAPGAGLNAANEFVEFEGWIAEQKETDFTVTEADWRSIGIEREPYEALFVAHDLPPVAAGAAVTVDLAIPDMTGGDFVESVRMSGGMAGLLLRSATAMAGMVRLVFENPTAATIDRAPADLGVAFFKPVVGG